MNPDFNATKYEISVFCMALMNGKENRPAIKIPDGLVYLEKETIAA